MRLYKLFNEDKELLYVGQTTNRVKQRIKQHFQQLKDKYTSLEDKNIWVKDIAYFSYSEQLENAAELDIYEIYEMSRSNPKENIRNKHEEEPSFTLPKLEWGELHPISELNYDVEEYKQLAKKLEKKREEKQKERQEKIHEMEEDVSL